MTRFFIDEQNIAGKQCFIDGEDLHHAKRVLRVRRGDDIIICDGSGMEYISKVEDVQEQRVVCEILHSRACPNEPAVRVELYQGVLKSDKMDYVIQKCVELGVSGITPVYTSRTEVRDANKVHRWNKIAKQAAQQCGRGMIPAIASPVPFSAIIDRLRCCATSFAAYECEAEFTLKNFLSKAKPNFISFVVGPEGGFDAAEIDTLKDAGIPSVSLGRRILRAETAGLFVLSGITYQYEL